MVFFAGHRQRLFPRYGDFDGSVNDSITPSFIDCIFALPYQPVIVRNSEEALKTTCDGFYFGSESPTEQSELTRRYGPRPLLLIAEQNTDCSIGSAFCLIINDDRVRFSVNLDVLTHSGVRVNPDVLMLARKKPHE